MIDAGLILALALFFIVFLTIAKGVRQGKRMITK